MLVVVSPAKKLDMDPVAGVQATQPVFPERTRELVAEAAKLTSGELEKLMKISPNLAKLNQQRFSDFGSQDRKPAAFAFAGDTFQGLEAATLDADALRWAQDHLRILSGLYGILRPLDEIEPYRLEMGSRLKTEHGKNLYEYWGSALALELSAQAKTTQSTAVVNCASQEYFQAVDTRSLSVPVISPVFMESTEKGPKIISFYAKRARGAMARFVVSNRIATPAALCDFDAGGYRYEPNLSSENKPVFLRA
ncbi:MAG: peroxide stress protein YaaA [Paracoccaceae bacterium]